MSHSKGRNMVAIKRLDRKFGQGDPEFLKEIMMLSRYTHQNLISLLGYCDQGGEKILVYEYASNGSLDQRLSDPHLSWTQRLKICIGAAKGLSFLHEPNGTYQRVLHCDIKSANILLDEDLNAKVADLGLAKLGPSNLQCSFLFTNAGGTPGYCDPQYMITYTLTKESDIYSFGVVLLEVLCGRLCYELNRGQFKIFVPTWKQRYTEKKLKEIVFHDIMQQMDPTSLEIFSDVAFQCLQNSREERPTMSNVLKKLELALEYQELHYTNPSQDGVSENMQFNAMVENMRMAYSEYETCVENAKLPSDDLDISSLQPTEFWREGAIRSNLHHRNIAAFYGVVQDGPGGTLATVTEFISNHSLRHLLDRKDRYLERRRKSEIVLEAAIGMEYLHSKRIIHFDLKCDNLFAHLKYSDSICKVDNFGLSKMKRNTFVSGGVRKSLPWMAPELLNGSSSKVSEKVDVFSFGIVLWEILTREEPYADMHYGEIIGGIASNTLRPPIPNPCDGEWRELMEQCWASDPMVRPSFTEITHQLRAIYASSLRYVEAPLPTRYL